MRTRHPESGFTIAALMCIITAALVLTAATVPVYQMQARRELEKELLFRGEEYIRAIQKYQRKYPGNYPASIDDLLARDGLRFLRKQYKDPITGEDFRLISVNPDGSLTNALTMLTIPIPAQGPGVAPGGAVGPGGAAGTGGAAGGNQNRGTAGNPPNSAFGSSMGLNVSMGTLTGGAGGAQGGPGNQGAQGGAGGANRGAPGGGVGNAAPGRGGVTGVAPAAGGGIGAISGGTGVGTGGGIFGGVGPNTGGVAPNTPGQNRGNAGQAFGGAGALGGGGGGTGFSATGAIQQIGPGIAGVASDSVATSVMIYNTREKYNEWEFVAPFVMQQQPSANNSGGSGGRGNEGAGGNNPFGNPSGRGSGIVPTGAGANPTTTNPFTNPSNNPFTQGQGQGQGGNSGGAGATPRGPGR